MYHNADANISYKGLFQIDTALAEKTADTMDQFQESML